MSIKVILLVHGYWLDGSAWRKVIPLLSQRGFETIAVQINLNSLTDDAAIVKRAIEMQKDTVLLVGQSYGGAVISEAGNHDQVGGLVYVAGAAPDDGQTVDDWWKGYATAAVAAELRPFGDGHTAISRHGVHNYLAHDLSPDDADLVFATQRPFGARSTSEVIKKTAWRTKPAWYIVTTLDHTVPPAAQQDSAERMGAEILVLQASHVPMLSQPDRVAEFIANAAASFS